MELESIASAIVIIGILMMVCLDFRDYKKKKLK